MVEPQDYLVPIASRDSQDRNDLSRFDGRGEHLRALVTEHIHRGVVTGKLRDHPLREFRDLCGRRIYDSRLHAELPHKVPSSGFF